MPPERGIHASAYALVHATAATPDERERHAAFLSHMLLLAFVALAVAPLFLAFHGAPSPAESLLFALSLAPAGAAMVVARTGRLVLGHVVASAGLAGGALVLFFGVLAGPAVAAVWLAAACVETAASLDRRLGRLGAPLAGVMLLVIVSLAGNPRLAATVSPESAALLASFAASAAALAARRMTAATLHAARGEALRDARDSAIDAMLDAVVVGLDAGGSVSSLSKPAGSFLAVPDHAILGRGLLDRVLVADRPAFLKLVDDAAHGAHTVDGSFRLRATDGEADGRSPNPHGYATVAMRARRVGTPSSPPSQSGVVAVLTDITDRERRADAVAEARHAVEDAVRIKDQFLTTMSHELRTPLNSIIGFSEILASRTTRPDDIARQCEFARVINQSGQHLLALVNVVLDVSRLQSGTFPIQPEAFDAVALLDQAMEAVAVPAREASLRLVRDYQAGLDEMVGDKRALRQALVALLSNAIKFTPRLGQVTVTARPDGNALRITVADTGVGIAADDLSRIGEPFFQARGSIGRPFEGSGLGLALVRGLVGLHGGTLAIDSADGLGTRATVRLPLDCRAVATGTPAAIVTSVLPQPRLRPATPIKDAA